MGRWQNFAFNLRWKSRRMFFLVPSNCSSTIPQPVNTWKCLPLIKHFVSDYRNRTCFIVCSHLFHNHQFWDSSSSGKCNPFHPFTFKLFSDSAERHLSAELTSGDISALGKKHHLVWYFRVLRRVKIAKYMMQKIFFKQCSWHRGCWYTKTDQRCQH